ncbi:MAG: ribonuclease HI family protein [Nitrospinota bacterium]|nr:ribonuclease HI family protein [Nitrospinota bacterium]
MANCCKIVSDACCHINNAHIKGRVGYGSSACGALIIDDQGNEHEFSKYLGEKTVLEAEFEGLIFALDKAVEVLPRDKPIEVCLDSKLVVGWMNKKFKMTKEHIKPLFDEANKLASRFKLVTFVHHSRDNALAKRADHIAKKEYKKYNP